MYNILVVDDEQWIRKGIIAKLQNNHYMYNQIFEAEDGKDALHIMNEFKINIVITDIRMSFMNGLDLIKKIKEKHQNIKFIIITGHAEFEYAKQALDMQVNGFLLKPIKDKELVKIMDNVISQLGHGNTIKENYMVEQKLNQCFNDGEYKGYENYPFTFYSLALIQIEESDNLLTLKSQIKKILIGHRLDFNLEIINNYRDNKQIIVIFMDNNKDHLHKNRNCFLYEVFDKINNEIPITVTIGVSHIMGVLNRTLYNQANDTLLFKLLKGTGNIYFYKEQIKNHLVKEENIKLMEKYIQCDNLKSIKALINELFDENNFSEDNIVHVKYLFFKIIRSIRYYFRETSRSNEILDIYYNEKEVFEEFSDMHSIKKYLISNISDLLNNSSNNGDVKFIIKKAIKYVDTHYDKDITIKDLSTKLSINSNYLSTLFKRETSKTFTQYLTELRINNAKKLLKDTDANVAQVSKSVGYQDHQYFYRVFKKYTGQTPLSYRKYNINN